MPARFFCQTGAFAGSSFEIADEAVIGRNEDDVRLPAEVVSGTHARIYFDAERGAYFLEDLGSRNGTKLDGMPVTGPVKLGRLHVVTFADQIDFIYHEDAGAREAAPRRESEHTQPLAFTPGALPGQEMPPSNKTVRTDAFGPGALPTPPPDGAQQTRIGDAFAPPPNLPGTGSAPRNGTAGEAASPRFSLEVTKRDRGHVTFPLSEGENIVGRASNCAVSLDDQSVSRRHAAMTVRNGRVMLRDLGSRNHTFINGSQVDSEIEVPLGAVLRFGLESEARLRRA